MVRTTVIAVHMTKNRHHSSPVQQLVKTITLTQVSDANMTESCYPSWSVNRVLVSLRPGFDEICRPRHPGSGSEYTNWKTESGVSQQEGANLIMTRCSSDHRLLALGLRCARQHPCTVAPPSGSYASSTHLHSLRMLDVQLEPFVNPPTALTPTSPEDVIDINATGIP